MSMTLIMDIGLYISIHPPDRLYAIQDPANVDREQYRLDYSQILVLYAGNQATLYQYGTVSFCYKNIFIFFTFTPYVNNFSN
jgi:hypothetical protein